MVKFSESIAIKAPVDEVFSLLADFKRYPKFIKEMKAVEVLEEKGNRKRVKFCVNMVKDVTYTLDMQLAEPKSISWVQVEADMIKSQQGGWTLTPLEKHLTDARFTVDVEFPFWVPVSIAEAGIRAAMPNMMKAVKKEAEQGKAVKSAPAKKAAPAKKPLAKKKAVAKKKR